MPLDLDALDDIEIEEKKPTTKVADPQKKDGKPESPQSRISRGKQSDNPWPKGQVVAFTNEQQVNLCGFTGGTIVASRKARGDYYNLKLELPDGEEVSIRSSAVRLAGPKAKDKIYTEANPDTEGDKEAASPEAADASKKKGEPEADPKIEELKQAARDFPVGSRVILAAAKTQVLGTVQTQPLVSGQKEHVHVEVLWDGKGPALTIIKGLRLATEEEISNAGEGLTDEGLEEHEKKLEDQRAEVPGDDLPDVTEEDVTESELVNEALAMYEVTEDNGLRALIDIIGTAPAEETSFHLARLKEYVEALRERMPKAEDGPVTPAPAFSDDLQKYVGLTDNLEVAKLIGLPIEFKVANIGMIVRNLRTIIGLPVGTDAAKMAEKIQRDHFWVQSTYVALEWAAKEAATTLESWEAAQISENWRLAREQYERDTVRWKAKEIDRPLAPDRSVIKSEIKGSSTWLEYQRALNKIEYWRNLFSKVAVAGHDRKAMLLMNINKAAPQDHVSRGESSRSSLDDEMTPGSDIALGESELDDLFPSADGEPPPKSNGGGAVQVNEEGEAPYEGKGELYPWLLEKKPETTTCGACEATVYFVDGWEYDVDETLHEKTCKGGAQDVEASDDGLADLDLDDLDLGGGDTKTETEPKSAEGSSTTDEDVPSCDEDVSNEDVSPEDDGDFLAGMTLEID
jgi:hypothetical protein